MQRVSEETGVEKSTILDGVSRTLRNRRYAEKKKEEARLARSVEDRYNVKSYERQNIGSVAAERRLLALLCSHPDLCGPVSRRLKGSDFVSAEAGAIFDAVCALSAAGEFTGYTSASGTLSSDLMGVFSAIVAENAGTRFSVEDCDYYVDKIIERSARPTESDLRTMTAEDIQAMIDSRNNSMGDKK